MINLILTRDEARTIQRDFFNYFFLFTKIQNQSSQGRNINFFIVAALSILKNIKLKFEKKLNGPAMRFKIKLLEHEAIIFYMALMNLPIEEKQVFYIDLRNRICEKIYPVLSSKNLITC